MLNTTIVLQSLVNQDDRLAMYELQARYFCNLNKEVFLQDMSEKDWIIVLRDENNRICGFSTIGIIQTSFDNFQQVFLFSGDTIVDIDFRYSSSLAGGFGHMMLRLDREFPNIPCYWFLISKGYRTYRFLPVFFRHFYPVYNAATPPEYQSLLDNISRIKFKDNYDPLCGVIKFASSKDFLKPEKCKIPAGRTNDPHISFFLEKNPGYIHGDELACIASISLDNLNRAGHRMIKNTKVKWHE